MGILPPAVREMLERERAHRGLEEIRLRRGRNVRLIFGDHTRSLNCRIGEAELEYVLRQASRSSVHTVLPQLRQGFIALPGGHRLGICGVVSMRDGEIHGIESAFGMNIRLATAIPEIGRGVISELCRGGEFVSTLILAPPGAGKTTLLRDIIRCLSDGIGCDGYRVGLVDERGELAALYRGTPWHDVGENTDIIAGCPKELGFLMLLRGMNPQILAADDITAEEDIRAMELVSGCGVQLLCTAHGAGREDLEQRPLYREMVGKEIFRKLLTIRVEGGRRRYEVEEL